MSKRTTILLVDDEENNISLIINSLKDTLYDFKVANELKTNPKFMEIPYIFLTALKDDESLIKGFKSGARDYITKPFRKEELKVRVENHVTLSQLLLENKANWIEQILSLNAEERVVALFSAKDLEIKAFKVSIQKTELETYVVGFADISENILIQRELENRVIHAPLTEAYNRHYFNIIHKKEIKKAQNENKTLAIAVLDIDFFKNIIDNLRLVIQNHSFETVNHITCSIGGSFYTNNEDINQTIKRADEALYIAKQSGRNQICIK